ATEANAVCPSAAAPVPGGGGAFAALPALPGGAPLQKPVYHERPVPRLRPAAGARVGLLPRRHVLQLLPGDRAPCAAVLPGDVAPPGGADPAASARRLAGLSPPGAGGLPLFADAVDLLRPFRVPDRGGGQPRLDDPQVQRRGK